MDYFGNQHFDLHLQNTNMDVGTLSAIVVCTIVGTILIVMLTCGIVHGCVRLSVRLSEKKNIDSEMLKNYTAKNEDVERVHLWMMYAKFRVKMPKDLYVKIVKMFLDDNIFCRPRDEIILVNKCKICDTMLKTTENFWRLPCGHIFHIMCIKMWRNDAIKSGNRPRCPYEKLY